MKPRTSYLSGDALLNQLEKLASTSDELLVAMAFASVGGVERFAERIRQAVGKRKLSLRVILDRSFSPTQSSRELIIDQLRRLGAKIRIAETPAMMHSKLYIFRSGDSLSAVCGSANLTQSGFRHNIELSNVTVDVPNEPRRQLTEWFETQWAHSNEVNSLNLPEMVKSVFRPGVAVVIPAIEKCGVIIEPPEGERNRANLFWVRCGVNEVVSVNGDHLALSQEIRLDRPQLQLVAYRSLSDDFDLISMVEEARIIVYPHQVAPVLSVLKDDGCSRLLVADEVGLGKTITAALLLAGVSVLRGANRLLVICPSGLEAKWRWELLSRFGLPFEVLSGESLATLAALGFDKTRNYFHIISHELLRVNASRMTSLTYQAVVVDEIHRGRNSATLTHKAISQVSARASYMLGLSATPIQTSSADLVAVLSLIGAQALEDKLTLDERVALCRASRKLRNLPNAKEFEALKQVVANLSFPQAVLDKLIAIGKCLTKQELLEMELNELCSLGGRIFRTTKSDLGNRIPRSIHNIFVALGRDSEKEYLRLRHEANKQSALSSLLSERLFCSSEQLARERSAELLSGVTESSETGGLDAWDRTMSISVSVGELSRKERKLLQILEHLHSVGRKAVIFCGFVATSKRLANIIREKGRYLTHQMDGETPVATRLQYIQDLRDQDVRRADFLVTTSVGQEGLDMQFVDTIVNYDLPWNPMVLEQRIGRIDRLGQKAPVLHIYNFYVYAGSRQFETVDKRLMRVLLRRLSEVGLHIGQLAAVLSEREGRNEESDEISRALRAVQQVNEWLPGLKIDRFGDISEFVKELEQRMIPGKWLLMFVVSLAPEVFPGTVVATLENDIVIRPTASFLAAAKKHSINRKREYPITTVNEFWFCTTDRERANEVPELIQLTPQHPIVRALAEKSIQEYRDGIPESVQGSQHFLKISDAGSLKLCDKDGIIFKEPASKYYAVLALAREQDGRLDGQAK